MSTNKESCPTLKPQPDSSKNKCTKKVLKLDASLQDGILMKEDKYTASILEEPVFWETMSLEDQEVALSMDTSMPTIRKTWASNKQKPSAFTVFL